MVECRLTDVSLAQRDLFARTAVACGRRPRAGPSHTAVRLSGLSVSLGRQPTVVRHFHGTRQCLDPVD